MNQPFTLRESAFFGLTRLLVVRYVQNIRAVVPNSKSASDCHLKLKNRTFIWPSYIIDSIFDTTLIKRSYTLRWRKIFVINMKTMAVLLIFEKIVPITFFKSFDDFLYLFLHH